MYFAPQAGHAPHLVRPSGPTSTRACSTRATRRSATAFWRARRSWGSSPTTPSCRRSTRTVSRGTGPDGQPWPMLDTVRPWDSLTDDEKRLFTRMAEVFAGYISYYDDRLGRRPRLPRGVRRARQHDHRRVSDNGASGEGGPNGSFNEWRFFNGVPDTDREHASAHRRAGHPGIEQPLQHRLGVGVRHAVPVLEALGGYEGGMADMCLVSWPARIPAQAEARQQYVHAVDVVPTLYELLGIEPPEVLKGYPQSADRGRELRGGADRRRRAAASRRSSTRCSGSARSTTRAGSPATVHPPLSGWGAFEKDVWELYHLERTDRSRRTSPMRNRATRDAQGAVVLQRRLYNGLPLDDRIGARAGARRAAPRRAAARPVRLLSRTAPTCPSRRGRRSRVGRTRSPPASRSTPPMPRESSGPPAASRAGTSLYIKDGTLSYTFNWVGHDAPGRGRRARRSHPGRMCARPSSPPRAEATTRRCRGARDAHALRRRPTGRLEPDRHPARLLLPDGGRHLRRPRQPLGRHAGVPGPVPVHGRHDRQGRRRRVRRARTSTTRRRSGPGSRID